MDKQPLTGKITHITAQCPNCKTPTLLDLDDIFVYSTLDETTIFTYVCEDCGNDVRCALEGNM